MSVCPVCSGSGVSPIPHVPSIYGGWADQLYNLSGIECGACNGSGRVSEEPIARREPRQPCARDIEGEFREAMRRLDFALEISWFFVPEVTWPWRRALQDASLRRPDPGLELLKGIAGQYLRERERIAPGDWWSMGIPHQMEFREETAEIERLMERIHSLLLEVIDARDA